MKWPQPLPIPSKSKAQAPDAVLRRSPGENLARNAIARMAMHGSIHLLIQHPGQPAINLARQRLTEHQRLESTGQHLDFHLQQFFHGLLQQMPFVTL